MEELQTENITIEENTSLDRWNEIKQHISPDIKELTIPLSLIEKDLEYLTKFKKLEKIKLTGYNVLTKEQLDKLTNTTIKEIDATVLSFTYENLLNEPNTLLVGSVFQILIYKGITIRDSVKKLENNTNDYIRIKMNTLDKNLLEKLFKMINTSGLEEILIETNNKNQYRILVEKEKSISITIKGTIEDVIDFYNYFNTKGIKINNIKLELNDKDKYNQDYSKLEEINKKVKLRLSYEASIGESSLEEFIGLSESIKWYRSLINTNNLTPTEKLMYAYDILKTFKYNSSDLRTDSRDPHRIMVTGNIVCRGYAALLSEILNGIDENLSLIEVGVSTYNSENDIEYHSRNVVRIDDNTYNIHGLFVLDPTWDSIKTDDPSLEILGNNYTALDLYRYFLIPYDEYKKTFGNDSLPSLFDKEDYSYKTDNKKLFKKELTEEEIDKYIHAKRPTLEEFNQMLYKVRISEGFTHEEALKEIEKVYLINERAINEAHKDGKEIEFFESNSIRKSA